LHRGEIKSMSLSNWRTLPSRTFTGLGILSIGAGIALNAQAHPVVFADGIAIMGHQHGKMSGLEVIYSPNWYTGFGLEIEKNPNHTSLLGRASLLAWRGNYPDLQTNVYVSVAAGEKWNSDSEDLPTEPKSTAPIAQWSTEWDAEDREYYGRVKYRQLFEENKHRNDELLVRVGFAPYKAQADEPAIWGMLEWKNKTKDKFTTSTHELTPLMRYFYKNALFEVGSSLSGKFAFNYMYHFF